MRAVLHRHLEAESRHDAEAAAATYCEDGYYEQHALGLRFEGREAIGLQYAASYQAIADMHAEYHAEIFNGESVAQYGTISGTVEDAFVGVPASGRVEFPFVAIIRFRDGLMAGEEVYYDLDAVCSQLGIDPAAVLANADGFKGTLAKAI